jgi:hypothetical protein
MHDRFRSSSFTDAVRRFGVTSAIMASLLLLGPAKVFAQQDSSSGSDKQPCGHYTVKNFGRGPALKVVDKGGMFMVGESLEIQTRMAQFACDSAVSFATGTVPVVGIKQPGPFDRTLFSGQSDDIPIDFNGPVETLAHLRFIGCVGYLDQFNTAHWTKFCMERTPGDPTPSGKIPKLECCSTYNETDQPKNR